jgi:hypothetical protein
MPACQRDALITLNPHFVGHREVTFYPHDEVPINFRRMSFSRKCWIMLLGYPLDFKDATTFVEVCTPFVRVLHWSSEDSSMSRVLLKVLVEDLLEVPRDVVIKIGRESDGEGCSWTVPIYIFNSEALMAGLADEDLSENNGDPHPFHGPILPGEQHHVAGLADQFMEEVLQHNPYPIVAALEQGSNMGSLTRNLANESVEVLLDSEVCKARVQHRVVVLALSDQNTSFASGTSSDEPLNQLVISGNCKITTSFKSDGSFESVFYCYPRWSGS